MLQRPLVTVKVLPLKVSGEGLCAANENLQRRSLHQEECERLNSGKNNIEDEIECIQLEVMVCAWYAQPIWSPCAYTAHVHARTALACAYWA